MFASMVKSSLKCTCIYAADVKSRHHFQDKKVAGRGLKNIYRFCLGMLWQFSVTEVYVHTLMTIEWFTLSAEDVPQDSSILIKTPTRNCSRRHFQILLLLREQNKILLIFQWYSSFISKIKRYITKVVLCCNS